MTLLTEDEITSGWDSEKPLVSICCITYKQVEYIEQTLNSLLAQKTTFPFEVIVSDDCSHDGSEQVLAHYAENYPAIVKVISSTHNLGGNSNLWKTLNAAKGKYIACCEGDDYWCDVNKLQRQVDFLDANPDYSVHIYDCYEEVNAKVSEASSKLTRLGIRTGDYTSADLKQEFCMILVTACFKNIGEFEYPRYFDKSISGDTLLNLMLSDYGKAHVDSSRKVAVYRIFDGGVWSKLSQENKFYESMHTCLVHARYFSEISEIKMSNFKMNYILFSIIRNVNFFSFANYTFKRLMKKILK
tara:strand:+ start:100 stop:999 length:900 start_codon:yes stop_codon:yes gene_type:complete